MIFCHIIFSFLMIAGFTGTAQAMNEKTSKLLKDIDFKQLESDNKRNIDTMLEGLSDAILNPLKERVEQLKREDSEYEDKWKKFMAEYEPMPVISAGVHEQIKQAFANTNRGINKRSTRDVLLQVQNQTFIYFCTLLYEHEKQEMSVIKQGFDRRAELGVKKELKKELKADEGIVLLQALSNFLMWKTLKESAERNPNCFHAKYLRRSRSVVWKDYRSLRNCVSSYLAYLNTKSQKFNEVCATTVFIAKTYDSIR